MTEYYIPTGSGDAEYVEKRSRFLGKVRHVESEEEARAFIEAMKKQYHDARHNCWCYLLKNGVLLGAGPLLRAYQTTAKETLNAAGVSVVRRWVELTIPCGYNLLGKLTQEIPLWEGIVADTEYGADVTIKALLPEGKEGAFAKRVLDLTSGTVQATVTGESLKAVPVR